VILETIINAIEVLESRGIEGLGGSVCGSIVQVTGDNLVLHCLFGYVESFRALHCCRFCLNKTEDYYPDSKLTLNQRGNMTSKQR